MGVAGAGAGAEAGGVVLACVGMGVRPAKGRVELVRVRLAIMCLVRRRDLGVLCCLAGVRLVFARFPKSPTYRVETFSLTSGGRCVDIRDV